MARPSDKNISSWFFELSESLASGFDAVEAVKMADGVPTTTKEILANRFRSGSSWGDAIEEHCGFLQRGEISIISAAEDAGKLSETFKELGEVRKETASFKSRIKFSSIYPLGLLHFGSLVFPINYLIESEIEAYLVSVGMILIPLWSLVLLLLIAFKLSPGFKKLFQLCIPIIRGYSINRDLSRFSRTFSACIRSGMPIELCWQLALDSANSKRLDSEGDDAIRAIKGGHPASEMLTEKGAYPKEFRQLYRMGERTGDLEDNIARAAEMYSSKARRRLMAATLVYPQLLFLLIAVFVAIKVISFYKGYFDGILKILE